MVWKTYLILYFGTKERKPSEIEKTLSEMGFESEIGPVDFIYHWGENQPTKEQILGLADKIAEALKDSGAMFNIDTHN